MTSLFADSRWVWRDGEIVPWADATIHVMSHVVHYGSSVIEGIRSYATPQGTRIFRLEEHMDRFLKSCAIYRMPLDFDVRALSDACWELLERNGLEGSAYIRPVALRGLGSPGLDPNASPVQVCIVAWPWGAYLGTDAIDRGVSVCISTWNRPAPNTHPVLSKAGGNYLNSQLMKMEAVSRGFDEAIGLSTEGLVSEASAQNIFLVHRGELLTPPLDGTILGGITRDTVIAIADDLDIPFREARIPRELLYIADEAFLCGTASEVVPVTSVDQLPVGQGRPGEMTRRIIERFRQITRGEVEDTRGWMSRPGVARRQEEAGATGL